MTDRGPGRSPSTGAGQLRWYGLDGVEHTGGPLVDFDGVHVRGQSTTD